MKAAKSSGGMCPSCFAWLARNESTAERIRHGLVVACVGDAGAFHYKRSRRGDAEIDRAVVAALRYRGDDFHVRERAVGNAGGKRQ